MHWRNATILAAAALAAGCAGPPRTFDARLAAPPADEGAFYKVDHHCREQVAAGRRDHFVAEGAATTGAGVAATYGVGAAAAAGAATYAGAAIAMSAMIVAAPVAMYATSRMIRSAKEKEINQARARCLQENGYTVASWELIDHRTAAAATAN